jgi:HEAT repeat protein
LIRSLDDQSIVVREKAAKSLGKLGNLDAEEPLLSALKSNTNLSIIYSIIEALGQIGSAKSVETLLTFLTHKESKVRECTASTLGKIKDIRSVNPLITALSDEQERVRWYAADSLGKIGEPICVESLAKLLTDASARVRESAVTALGQIGNQQSVESLIKVLQDIDKRVAEQAAESLVNIKQRDFETINTIANTFYEKKDYKRAEIILERQILELSKQPELLEKALQSKNKLAKTLLALKDWQKAYDIYKELAKRFSSDDSLKMELIQCLREMKKYDLLLEWYATWIKESPQNNQLCWQGRLETANAMFEQGKYESIINLIEYLKGEDPAMGGEEFKANFQRLHESCLAERKQLKTTRQISEAK